MRGKFPHRGKDCIRHCPATAAARLRRSARELFYRLVPRWKRERPDTPPALPHWRDVQVEKKRCAE